MPNHEPQLARLLRQCIPADAEISVNLRLLHDICPLIERGLESRIYTSNELEAFEEICRLIGKEKAKLNAKAA